MHTFKGKYADRGPRWKSTEAQDITCHSCYMKLSDGGRLHFCPGDCEQKESFRKPAVAEVDRPRFEWSVLEVAQNTINQLSLVFHVPCCLEHPRRQAEHRRKLCSEFANSILGNA
jgi:hypothetical protein